MVYFIFLQATDNTGSIFFSLSTTFGITLLWNGEKYLQREIIVIGYNTWRWITNHQMIVIDEAYWLLEEGLMIQLLYHTFFHQVFIEQLGNEISLSYT